MLRPPSALTWVVVLTIGGMGWALLAFTVWQHRQSQESWMQTRHQLEDQVAFHDLARRRFEVRNAGLGRQVAALNSEIDELVKAQGGLAAIEERRQQASERLLAMEAKKKAAEVAIATLALQHEVMKSRYAASEIASLWPGKFQLSNQAPATDARRKTTSTSSQLPATHAFREGLYAFAKLKVSEPESEGGGGMSIARQAVHAKSEDDRTTDATVRSIKAAFKRADAPQSLSRTDWAEAQLELGQTLVADGHRRSGTRKLKEAVLAFRAVAGEWSREKTPLKWATVRFELGRTLALLSRRSGDPSARQESIAALGSALDILIRAGESPRAAEAKRLLDEIEAGSDPRQP